MKILALEFSANVRSVAVATCKDERSIEILALVKETSREVTGLALIDRAVRQAKLNPAEITEVVVGLGPGSYTGIRSAIALAQGWQLGRDVRVTGIGSVEVLVRQAQDLGKRGDCSFVVDAQRGEIYQQVFNIGEQTVEQRTELRIVRAEEAGKFTNVVGPEARKFFPDAVELSPSAEFLARLRVIGVSRPAEQLQPIYLREPAFVKAPAPRQIG